MLGRAAGARATLGAFLARARLAGPIPSGALAPNRALAVSAGAASRAAPPAPPKRTLPPLPKNVVVENEGVLSTEEDERLSFQYNIVPGPKFAPLLKVTAARTFETEGQIQLNESVFGSPVRKDIIHNVVVWQRAKRRQGTSKIKGISEVRGTGKKPFAQKGTGKARQGSLRAPQMRKGADPHGKDNPDYSFKLNKKVRRFGMRSVLSARLYERQVFVVDSFELPPDAAPSLPAKRSGAVSRDAAAVPKEPAQDRDAAAVPKEPAQGPAKEQAKEQAQEPAKEQAKEQARWKTKDISAIVQKFKWQNVAFIDKYAFTKDFEMATRNVPFTTHFPSELANVYDLLKCKVLVISKSGLAELTSRLDEQAQKARFYSKRASK